MHGEIHVGERAAKQEPRCPYCHGEIAVDAASAWACLRCGTSHHQGCARENGRCTLLGCGAPYTAPPVALTRPRGPVARGSGTRGPLGTASHAFGAVGVAAVVLGFGLMWLDRPSLGEAQA